jgi:hypothetical protein
MLRIREWKKQKSSQKVTAGKEGEKRVQGLNPPRLRVGRARGWEEGHTFPNMVQPWSYFGPGVSVPKATGVKT